MKQPIVPEFSAAAFLIWEESQDARFELHHGFAVSFAGGTFSHDRVAFALRNILERLFPSPCMTFGSDLKVQAAETTFFYCDVGVICEPIELRATVIHRPRIVAEVVSRSTRAYDIVEKRAAYRAMASVEAYLIVHTDMRRIEVDARGISGRWMTETYDDEEAFVCGQRFELDAIYGPEVG